MAPRRVAAVGPRGVRPGRGGPGGAFGPVHRRRAPGHRAGRAGARRPRDRRVGGAVRRRPRRSSFPIDTSWWSTSTITSWPRPGTPRRWPAPRRPPRRCSAPISRSSTRCGAAEPGTPVRLRQADVDVLARALALAVPEVEQRLEGLMADPATGGAAPALEAAAGPRARAGGRGPGGGVRGWGVGRLGPLDRAPEAPAESASVTDTTVASHPDLRSRGWSSGTTCTATRSRRASGLAPAQVVTRGHERPARPVGPPGRDRPPPRSPAERPTRRRARETGHRNPHTDGTDARFRGGDLGHTTGMRDWLVAGGVIEGPERRAAGAEPAAQRVPRLVAAGRRDRRGRDACSTA